MRCFIRLLLVLVASLSTFIQARSASGNRLLVVIDDLANKDKYSTFWDDLKGRGFDISYATAKSEPALFLHGERAHDHLLVLPSKLKTLGASLSPNQILNFLKADGNILLGLSSALPTPTSLVSLLLELDIQIPEDRDALIVDHFNYDLLSAPEKHDILLLQAPKSSQQGLKNYFEASGLLALPRCVAQTLGSTNPLLSPILKAANTAYSYNPSEDLGGVDDLFAPGQQISLISAMQARNSARFTVLGSAEMLENTWFDASVQQPSKGSKKVSTGNREFAAKLSAWAFKESGVLKVTDVRHHLAESAGTRSPQNSTSHSDIDLNPTIYRIKNDVTFSISISEYKGDKWIPFQVPQGDDLQLEFTMLSPYHRLALTPAPSSSTSDALTYTTSFTLPDQHGIFNFRVNYKRPFLTHVDEKRHVTVRHFAHDEWPRSWVISGGWVWIVGVWGTVAGWLAFVFVWLYSEPTDPARKTKKTN